MAAVTTAAVVSVGGSYLQGRSAKKAAKRASQAQERSEQAALEEQRRQFDKMQELMKPYVDVGTQSLASQRVLLGEEGPEAQQAAIAQIEASPMFQSMVRQGEEAMLANASATGGLRGGNLQGALAQFRPEMLNQAINQQYSRLGDLTVMGQNSAAGVGTAAMRTGEIVGQRMSNIGTARAGYEQARGQANSAMIGSLTGAFTGALTGGMGGGGIMNIFGGGQ